MIKTTNEEIKKSLLLCSDLDLSCKDCLYHSEYVRCNEALSADARDLIIKQEQEIAQLKDEIKQLQTNAEILARGVRDLNHENYELTEQVKQAKIDVLNELKEKVKNAIDTYYNSQGSSYYSAEDVISDINNIIKEEQK